MDCSTDVTVIIIKISKSIIINLIVYSEGNGQFDIIFFANLPASVKSDSDNSLGG